jgi:hypothetical protein
VSQFIQYLNLFQSKEIFMPTEYLQLARRVTDLFVGRPEVEAIALGGSQGGSRDSASDIDLYIYTHADIPVKARIEIMERAGGASQASMGLDFWGPGDEWFDAETGIEVDMVYFDARWMTDQIKRVMQDHLPSMGYSTCFPFTVRQSKIFYDPEGWFAGLQKISQQPYPEPLRQNIITKNHPVLREVIPSYVYQIEKAVKRGDLVSVNHRLAGLFASYFDILFAFNRQLHPGEKRLVEKAVASCEKLPEDFETDLAAVLAFSANGSKALLNHLSQLLDRLDELLAVEGVSD